MTEAIKCGSAVSLFFVISAVKLLIFFGISKYLVKMLSSEGSFAVLWIFIIFAKKVDDHDE